MSRWKASLPAVLALLLPALLAVHALAGPTSLHPVACFDTGKAVLANGTILALPTLQKLADIGPVDGCDLAGSVLVAWRAGTITVYKSLTPVSTISGRRAFAGSRFILALNPDSVAVYSLYGFEVFRLDKYTSPAAVWVLGAQRAGSRAAVLVSPTTCRVRMQVESYLLVYDLETGLYNIYNTGAVSFIAVPSGALWVKNSTLYHNGRALGRAPAQLHPVHGLDGYASVEGGKVVVVALNGSSWRLRAPQGRGLAVSRLDEGFTACSDYECTCTFNCSFTQPARQAFTPLIIEETPTHYLLHGAGWLFLVEKPRAEANTTKTAENPREGAEPAPSATPAKEAAEPVQGAGQSTGAAEEPRGTEEAGGRPPKAPGPEEPEAAPPEGPAPGTTTEEPRPGAATQPWWLLAAALVVFAAYLLYRRRSSAAFI